jgi:DNA polymerase-3 subunit beta
MLKAKVKNEEFLKGLNQTSNIAGKFTSMPILSNVLLETTGGKLILNATDLEITFQASYPEEVLDEWKLAIPAKTLNDIVHSLSSDVVSLEELDSHHLEILGDSFKTRIYGISSDDFPKPSELGGLPMAEFDTESLMDAINKTQYSVTSTNNNNFNLSGIHWTKEIIEGEGEVVRLVSSDSNRLNFTTIKPVNVEEFQVDKAGIIVSKKGLSELKALAETTDKIKIGVNINALVAKTENSLLILRLLEGKFPEYSAIIASPPTVTLQLNRKKFLDILGRVSLVTSSKHRVIYFDFAPDQLTLRCENKELGNTQEELPIEYQGEEMTIGFDHRHLLDPLKSLNSEIFQLSIIQPDKPVKITAEGDPGYVGIVTTITQKP